MTIIYNWFPNIKVRVKNHAIFYKILYGLLDFTTKLKNKVQMQPINSNYISCNGLHCLLLFLTFNNVFHVTGMDFGLTHTLNTKSYDKPIEEVSSKLKNGI